MYKSINGVRAGVALGGLGSAIYGKMPDFRVRYHEVSMYGVFSEGEENSFISGFCHLAASLY